MSRDAESVFREAREMPRREARGISHGRVQR